MMKDCNQCEELRIIYEIKYLYEFKKTIRIVKENIKDKTIEQIDRNEGSEPFFTDVKDDGPWPDVMNYGFRCTQCGLIFRLFVETYHGSGGKWTFIGKE